MKALKILFILGFLSLRITSEEATTDPEVINPLSDIMIDYHLGVALRIYITQ